MKLQDYRIERFGFSTQFAEINHLCRRWISAKAGPRRPWYEDVALGSLGRLSDGIAIVQTPAGSRASFCIAGDKFEEIVGAPLRGLFVDDLPTKFRRVFTQVLSETSAREEPALIYFPRVTDAAVFDCELLGLPLVDRRGDLFLLLFIHQSPVSSDLVEAIYRSNSNGLLALSPCGSDAGASRRRCARAGPSNASLLMRTMRTRRLM